MQVADKTVVIAGLGVSGTSLAEVLRERGTHVIGVDERKPETDLHSFDDVDWDHVDYVMSSPVFNPRTPFVLEAQRRGIPVMSEVEFAWQLRVNNERTGTPAPWIGITGTNARPSVAPTFGVEGMFGTNPLTVGIPTDEDFDFLIDCATSITQNGKIEYYARIGEDVHPGTIIGRDGQPISGDSGEALKKIRSGDAALTTLGGIGEALGGYKGYGYAMVIELLSAVLQDGAYGKDLDGKDENGNIRPYHLGHFFIAIDTDHFLGQELTRKKAGEILRSVRASQKAPGADRIFTAGEKEWEIWQQRKDSGVPINDSVQKEILEVRDELGLTQYKFPWE